MGPAVHVSLGDSRNALGRLLAAYDGVRAAAGGMPRREQLGFEQLKGLLGWEFFAEWVAPASIVVRLSGAHIDYMLGCNVTGANFFAKYRADQRAVYSRFYGAIADHPCGGYSLRRIVVGDAEAFEQHSVYLPLAPQPRYVPIVGAVAMTGFERIAPRTVVGASPDYQALIRLGVFDVGFGPPPKDLASIDIAAVVREIDAAGEPALDKTALETRSPIGRPSTLR
jgi:hypothetical protein